MNQDQLNQALQTALTQVITDESLLEQAIKAVQDTVVAANLVPAWVVPVQETLVANGWTAPNSSVATVPSASPSTPTSSASESASESASPSPSPSA
jgi:hypothetical protein